MRLFDQQLLEINDWLTGKKTDRKVIEFYHQVRVDWPAGEKRNIVLGQDTAVELGNPQQESTAFLLWTNDPDKIRPGVISLIGRDLPLCAGEKLPFGKVVLIGGEDFNEENLYDRSTEMEYVRFALDLKGYMMRAVSQYQREWSRVSKEALQHGFSFQILGSALIDQFLKLEYIKAVEVIFITSSKDHVLELKKMGAEVLQIIRAMNKMAEEKFLDCDTCDYKTICDDVTDLKLMRASLQKKKRNRPFH
ncbi:hypothetical protein ACFL27_01945 [candidate division CSSED10-310 bacterium]|uniref:CO-methylating acetyl-CoA synthase n=1 Tax=candidate division CSSED10-310 bacterium TaxID=2855610 RepID=A0ABV6YS44_UNCC1